MALTGTPLATTPAATSTFALFPNPASGQVTLQLPASASGPAQVVLRDLSGRSVLTQALRSGTDTTISLPASLAAGVYLLQVQGSGFSGRPQRLIVH
ncbi:MAG: T9SS type A sorting domain-containing protein [Janthinobacterium lividum]